MGTSYADLIVIYPLSFIRGGQVFWVMMLREIVTAAWSKLHLPQSGSKLSALLNIERLFRCSWNRILHRQPFRGQ